MKRKLFSSLGAILVLLICWQLFSLFLNKPFLPAVPASLRALWEDCLSGVLPRHFFISFYRVALSLLLSVLLAVPAGLAMGQYPSLDRFFAPMLYLLYPLPKVVFLPIIVTLFGLGDLPKVFLITLMLFFQLLVVTRDASRQLREEYILSARSLGMSPGQLWKHVLIPACLPQILTSLRVGVGTGIAVLFFAETFASLNGLGYYISNARDCRAYDRMFAGILAMAAMGLLFYAIFRLLEDRLTRWQTS